MAEDLQVKKSNQSAKVKMSEEKKVKISKQSAKRKKQILKNKQRLARADRVGGFFESGGPITILMLLLVFVGTAQFIFTRMGMSTLLSSREVNGFTFYYFDVFNYLSTITANVDIIKNIPNDVYGDFTTNTDGIINSLITCVNCLIAALNVFTIGFAWLNQLLPLLCSIFGFAGGGLNFLTLTAELIASVHIPYIPYV